MEVTFAKLIEQRLTTWEARRATRTLVPGSHTALGRGDMPHDLQHLVVEGAAGIEHGFWGCVAAGATFESTGRKRTKPGRAVIAAHRRDLLAAERAVGRHVTAWRAGRDTPVTAALERVDARWSALGDKESLTIVWPSLELLDPTHSPGPPSGRTIEEWIEELAVPHRAKKAFRQLLTSAEGDQATLAAVRRGLTHRSAAVREQCCRILDHRAEPEAFPLLVERLDDEDPRVRIAAIHALACDRCKSETCRPPPRELVLDPAIRLLEDDPDPHVRARAAEVVGQHVHRDPRALDALERSAHADPAPAVRKKSAWYTPGGPIHEKTKPRNR